MRRKRTNPFSLGREPMFEMASEATVPVPDRSAVKHVAEAERIRSGVRDDLTEFAGNDTSFLLYGQPELLRFPAIGIPLVVATFTVPPGRTLEVNRIDWWCSEPFLYGNQQFGWRPAIDGAQVPFWIAQTPAARTDYMFLPLAPSTGNEPRFSPIFLYANSTLTVEILELTPTGVPFNSNVWVSTYVYGLLRKPRGVS